MKQSNFCHYGSNCRRNQTGNCPYKHRKDQLPHKNQNKSSSKGYHKQRERSRSHQKNKDRKKHKDYKTKYQQQRKNQNDYKKKSSKSKYQEKPKYQEKTPKFESRPQSQLHSSSKPYQRKQSHQNISILPFQKEFEKFCKCYHLEDKCEKKDNCTKIHGFMFEIKDCFRRRIFKKSQKFTKDIKLCFSIENDQYVTYIVKNQKQVIFYEYTPALNSFKEISFNILQRTKYSKNQYFGFQKGTVYFSNVNEDSLTDLTCYNFSSQTSYRIKNAHLKDVTGMMHLNQKQIITASMDGTIKIWNFDQQTHNLVMDHEKSLKFTNFYNTQNKKIELYFIEKTLWRKNELFLVGTSNSKILVFINKQNLSFIEIVVSKTQLKITKVKNISKINGSFQILALAHRKNKSYIYRITIDAVNQVKQEQIIELEMIEGRQINTFQVSQNLIFVSYGNQVIIYQLNEKVKTVGAILHRGSVKSLTMAECFLKTSGLKISVLGVLQGQSSEEKSQGHLNLYFVR